MYMKKIFLVILATVGMTLVAHAQQKHYEYEVGEGKTLRLTPLADNAVRVQLSAGEGRNLPEWTYVNTQNVKSKKYEVKDKTQTSKDRIVLPGLTAEVDRTNAAIVFYDKDGNAVLKENAMQLLASKVQDEPTWIAQAEFDAPQSERLYGLGQFQDGRLNVRGLMRRLTQVNTQIAMPMVLSSRGYALLWNNYGMTDFNLTADLSNAKDGAVQKIAMVRASEGAEHEVDATGTEGNRRERRRDGHFACTVDVEAEGDYAVLLDVGQTMARRHHLVVDGKVVIDVQNVWLPPTTSTMLHLSAGSHTLEADLTSADNPVISMKRVGETTVFSSPVSDGVDFTVFVGDADATLGSYRALTGQSPMLPMWAMGYIHCRERFHSSDEILSTVNTFRQKQYPLDVVVQDWQWWGHHGWNAMEFDEKNYPDPRLLVDSLHALNTRLMLSVWSKIDPNSPVGKQMNNDGYYIKGTSWIDFFNPKAAESYWDNFEQRLLRPYGIDCWWQDATEPENDDLLGRKIANGTVPGEVYRNTYPLLVSKTVYEGSRKAAPDHRTMILTRSGCPGIQRYGSVLWSGDVGHDWQTLRYQLAAGLGLMAAGHPWWTYDAGGFFRPGGQYTSPEYHERFLRWLELGTFLPLMRVHGYMTDTEFWRFGPEVERVAHEQLELRYSLMPYIYTCNYQVSQGGTMMRPLVMDFAKDARALDVEDEFMFGASLLVAPVFEPNVKERSVYLPGTKGGWYDFYTRKPIKVADYAAPVTLDRIPVFAKAGSVIPMAYPCQSTVEMAKDKFRICVFSGADGTASLYEDEGTNYNYEKGESVLIPLDWDDAHGVLTIGAQKGSYTGAPSTREIEVEFVSPEGVKTFAKVNYTGKKTKVSVKSAK